MPFRNQPCSLVSREPTDQKDDEGEQLPPESTKVQIKAEEIIQQTAAILTRLFDVTATKDWSNCVA
ncbi:MAG: hypothetical protein Fur005_35320 [Roseiflexaceae bacterium]